MPRDKDSSGVELDPITVEGDLLAINRSLVVRDSGIMVTLRFASHADTPVKYQCIDPLPGSYDLDEIGFHPDHQPSHGRIEDHQVVVGGVLDPDDERVVKYGMCPGRVLSPDAIEPDQTGVPPTIELEERIEAAEVDEVDLETPAMARGGVGSETADQKLFTNLKNSVFGGTDQTPAAREEPASANVETSESEEAAVAVAEAITDLEDDPDATVTDATAPESVEELFSKTEASDSEGPPTDDPQAGSNSPTGLDDSHLIDELVTALQAESPETERGEALATELSKFVDEPSAGLPRSAEVRLQQIESNMEEFAAYTEALRDLIDEHGTAEEFVTEIKSDLDTIETDLTELGADLDVAMDRLDDMTDTQDRITGQIDDLQSAIETAADERTDFSDDIADLEAALATLRRDASEARTDMADQIDALETTIDDVADEVADLREDVEDGKARRRAIAEALSGDLLDSSD